VAEQRVVLEHEADVALSHLAVGGVLAAEQHLPAVLELQPGDDAQQRGLAEPEGPSSATNSPDGLRDRCRAARRNRRSAW
jgi:hypothetical protein